MSAESPNPAACLVSGVSARHGNHSALNDVSFRAKPGEAIAVVGPSGAGKTTLLRVVSGLHRPFAGSVSVMGHPLQGMRPGRDLSRLVGMMQQQLDLVPQLAVKHNVQAGYLGRWSTMKSLLALAFPIETDGARNAATRVGLEDKFTTRVARLSGGEQQRVALARLIVQDPLLFVADEPVSALDPALADDHLGLLRSLTSSKGESKSGSVEDSRTLLASVHQPELALKHFDRIIGLKSGRIRFDKPAGDVTEGDLDLIYSMSDRTGNVELVSRPG